MNHPPLHDPHTGLVCGGHFRDEVRRYEEEGWRGNAAAQLHGDNSELTKPYGATEHPLTQLARHRSCMGLEP